MPTRHPDAEVRRICEETGSIRPIDHSILCKRQTARTKQAMTDHNNSARSGREMVRAHAYPVLSALCTLSLISIAVLLLPQAVRHHRFNRCVDAQIKMRNAINPESQQGPGKVNALKAVEHCEGR